MMFKRKRLTAIALGSALALTGCGAAGQSGSTSGSETLAIGVLNGPSTWATANIRWAQESIFTQAVYDTLLRAAADGSIEAGLATDWSWNDDATVLTLTLRDDVTFTDGQPLDAEAVRKSLTDFKNGSSPDVKNLADLTEVRVVDDQTVDLVLAEANPAFETFLTQNSGVVGSPADDDLPSAETTPVGSGPYTLNASETVVGSSWVFDKNDDYWDPSSQHYDRIVMSTYSDASAQLNAIRGGQLNVAAFSDNTQIPQIEAAGYTVAADELDWSGFVLADRDGTSEPALGDLRVRQAINYALDREAMRETIGAGYGEVTEQIFPEYSPSYDPELDEYYDYDLDKARALLAEAGYADGLTLTMPRPTNLPSTNFTLMQDQLAQIGIDVVYTDLQITEYISAVLSKSYPAFWIKLQQDPTDYQLATFALAQSATWNPFGVADETVAALVERIRTGDTGAGAELNQYIVENAWFAPFFRVQNSKAVDDQTQIESQAGNVWPYLWNIQPKN